MRCWEIGPCAGIGGLRQRERSDPQPGPGEVVVKVTAAGLNYRDLMVLDGRYGANLPEARVPLSDGVGVVRALGKGVRGIAPGQRVIAPHFTSWRDGPFSLAQFASDLGVTADGWLADAVVIPADALIAVPDAVSDASAAALAVAGATVWHAMIAFGEAGPGKLVLAQGTGGVSMIALKLAKAIGAQFAITSSSQAKLERCRALGADFAIDYRARPDWAAALLETSGGRGVDVVVDTLGFPAMGETVASCAVEARIGTVGALSGTPAAQAFASQGAMIARNLTIKGIASGSRAMLAAALETIAQHRIEIVIDRRFAFDDAPAAYRHLVSGAHLGKVLIEVG